jgi:hypothetical protein
LYFVLIVFQVVWERFYSVVVSISGCDPLDPGSNPGRANYYLRLDPDRIVASDSVRADIAVKGC